MAEGRDKGEVVSAALVASTYSELGCLRVPLPEAMPQSQSAEESSEGTWVQILILLHPGYVTDYMNLGFPICSWRWGELCGLL